MAGELQRIYLQIGEDDRRWLRQLALDNNIRAYSHIATAALELLHQHSKVESLDQVLERVREIEQRPERQRR